MNHIKVTEIFSLFREINVFVKSIGTKIIKLTYKFVALCGSEFKRGTNGSKT